MRWWLLFLVGCSGADGTGTIVFSDPGTGHVMSLDVVSGATQLIDGGRFGAVSINPDRQYVAYAGADKIVRVADRRGNITALAPGGGGCTSTPTWGPNHSLTYCISDQSGNGTILLPTIGATPRRLVGGNIAVSADGQQVVYKQWANPDGSSSVGDVVVENADGSDHRVLMPSVTDGGVYLFTPDQQHVLTPSASGLLEIALAEGSVTNLGSGAFVAPLPLDPLSNVSPDGTELLLFADKQYLGLNVATGERRYIADAPPDCGAAAFADADHIVCAAHQDTTMPGSDVGMVLDSIRVATGGSTTMLIPPPGTNTSCTLIGIARTSGYAAAACGNATLVSLDGTSLAAQPALDILGIAADESGVVAVTRDGLAFFLSRGGDSRSLAQAMSPFDTSHGDLVAPFVAYAP